MAHTFQRLLQLPDLLENSTFLWGPRKTGKSFLIRERYKDAIVIDLLQTDVFAEYATRPALLRERYQDLRATRGAIPIVIDEVQKCPSLLDEVHWLIENRQQTFLLTGSSARKLRRAHANLLAGRALRRELRPLCFEEIGEAVDLLSVMKSGLLPVHFLSSDPIDMLRSYVADYLKEEIAQEAAVRDLPSFAEFLKVAAITSGELLNYTNVGREAGVSTKTARAYFDILEDTLLGFRIPPWNKRSTRRLVETEKFYLFDVGVSNYLAKRTPNIGTPEFGKSFEHYILMELLAYKAYKNPDLEIAFWRTKNGQEVDFIVGDRELAVEVKGSTRVHEGDLKHLRLLADDGPVKTRVVVSLEKERRSIQERSGAILLLPWQEFLRALWNGEYF